VSYQQAVYAYRRSKDQDTASPARHPVIVVGAGPVGLSLSVDLAQHGVPVVLVDGDDRLSTGSRSICIAQRTLEIFDRLGCADAMVAKGVSWNVGKVFLRDELLYEFDVRSETGYERPPFINLQQYYLEGFLVDRAARMPLIDLRWKNAVADIAVCPDGVVLTLETPESGYRLVGDFVVACDGARSTIRQRLGLPTFGQQFEDHFLIADIKMKAGFPAERRFWFDAPFHRHQNVLLHRQPDDLWRIDFQLGRDADPEEERRPANVMARVRALLGPDVPVELEWASVYSFASVRMCSFRLGRLFFAGDAAHGVSPFGARGANSGVQDADNLAWKLAYVLHGQAGNALLDSYCAEREYAADENIRHSTRSTNFISPPTEISHVFRDAVLGLARENDFARTLVNTGRLSTATVLHESPLNTPDMDSFAGDLVPGAPAMDAPVATADGPSWLLRHLVGGAFTLLIADGPHLADRVRALRQAAEQIAPIHVVGIRTSTTGGRAALDVVNSEHLTMLVDALGAFERRYDMRPGTTYLLRPDQHVCARWRTVEPRTLCHAIRRALALH
jgi:3-(3-hydroxy-phenyl)propionate hydroxylase